MGGTLKDNLKRLFELYQRASNFQQQYKINLAHNKLNSANQYLASYKYSLRAIKSISSKINNQLNTNILEITYKINNEHIAKALLANISEDDAREYFKFLSLWHGCNIDILEIRITPTFIKDIPL